MGACHVEVKSRRDIGGDVGGSAGGNLVITGGASAEGLVNAEASNVSKPTMQVGVTPEINTNVTVQQPVVNLSKF